MATTLGSIQYGQDRVHQGSRRRLAEFYRNPGPRPLGLIHKIDVQGMFHRGIEGVIVGYVGLP